MNGILDQFRQNGGWISIAHVEAEMTRLQTEIDGLRKSVSFIRAMTIEEAAQVAEQPILPSGMGGNLILDKHTSVTIAAAIRSLGGGE